MTLDHHAALSRLRDVAPGFKLLFALPPIAMVLWADSVPFSLVVFVLMGGALMLKGGVRPADYLRWLLLPAGFLVIGTVAVAVDVSASPGAFIVSVPVGGAHIGVTSAGLAMAANLFFRTLASVSCLYFIAFTTPVVDLAGSMSAVGIPLLVIEITLLVYRFVFQLFDTAGAMSTAQTSRLGYAGLRATFRSLSALASNLFVFSVRRSEELYLAMECRGYDSTVRVLTPSNEVRQPSLAGIALVEAALLCVAVATHFWRLF